MSAASATLWVGGYFALLVAIVWIDWLLGSAAEYLNAYEVVRRSFATSWPEATDNFIWRSDHLGQGALTVAWVAFLIEGLLLEVLLYWGWRAVRSM